MDCHRLVSILKYTSSGRLDLICNRVLSWWCRMEGRQIPIRLGYSQYHSWRFALGHARLPSVFSGPRSLNKPWWRNDARHNCISPSRLEIPVRHCLTAGDNRTKATEQFDGNSLGTTNMAANRWRRQNFVVTIDWSLIARYQSIFIDWTRRALFYWSGFLFECGMFQWYRLVDIDPRAFAMS